MENKSGLLTTVRKMWRGRRKRGRRKKRYRWGEEEEVEEGKGGRERK